MDRPKEGPKPIPHLRLDLLKQNPQETAGILFDLADSADLNGVGDIQIGNRILNYDKGPDGDRIMIRTGKHTVRIKKSSGSPLECMLDNQNLRLDNAVTEDEIVAWNTLMNAVQQDIRQRKTDSRSAHADSLMNASRERATELLQM